MGRLKLIVNILAVCAVTTAGCNALFEKGEGAPEKPDGVVVAPTTPSTSNTDRAATLKEIEETLRSRLSANANDFSSRSQLGALLLQTNRIDEAETLFKEGLEIDEHQADSLRGMGEVAVYRRDVDQAIAWREKLLRAHPELPDAEDIHRENYYLRLFSRIGEDPETSKKFFGAVQAANTFAKAQRWGEAAAEYRKALDVVPDDPNVRTDLAVALREGNKATDAIAELEAALEIDPELVSAWMELSRTQAAIGKKDAAVATLKKLQKKKPHAAERNQVADRIERLAQGGDFDDRRLAMANGTGDIDPRSPRQTPNVSDATSISGTVRLASGVTTSARALFIYARREPRSGGGPPLAVKRITNPSFPLSFTLRQTDVPVPGMELNGNVFVSARLDGDGNASTKTDDDLSGDWVAATVGGGAVDLLIGSAAGPAPVNAGPKGKASKGTIQGVIRLDGKVADKAPRGATLYVYARAQPQGGMPLAVKQVPNPSFPFEFSLSSADAMVEGGPALEGKVYLIVRLDADGNAMTKEPGDLEAKPTAVTVGERVEVVIDQVRGGGSSGSSGSSGGAGHGGSMGSSSGGSSGSAAISGTIQLSSKLKKKVGKGAVLFVYAKKGPDQGPPLAVQRYGSPKFPLEFRLGPEDSMIQGLKLEGDVYISARLDNDGDAMTKGAGDFVNEPHAAKVGDSGIEIVIDQSL